MEEGRVPGIQLDEVAALLGEPQLTTGQCLRVIGGAFTQGILESSPPATS
jgi:hypothetical protein